MNGREPASPDLALRILSIDEMVEAGADFASLTGVQIPPGTPLGGGVVAASPPPPSSDRPAAEHPDTRTLSLPLATPAEARAQGAPVAERVIRPAGINPKKENAR